MRPPRPSSPAPNTKGWRAPWRRHWGPLSDGRSRLSRLARRIEQELLEEYIVGTLLARRRVRSAARFQALAEQTLLSIGKDRKATRRAVTALQGAADRQLAGITPRDKLSKPTSGAELLRLRRGDV